MPRTEIPNDKPMVHLNAGDVRQIAMESAYAVADAINQPAEFVKSPLFRKMFQMGEWKFEQLVKEGIIKRYDIGGLVLYDVKAFREYLVNKCEVEPIKLKRA